MKVLLEHIVHIFEFRQLAQGHAQLIQVLFDV
jgi:hypothetical protein